MSANRNKRLAWVAQEITKGQTNAQIIISCMQTFPGVSEKTARADLKEILQRFSEIDEDTLTEAKARWLAMGFSLLEDARKACQFGPAVSQFKNLAQIAGVMHEKPPESSGAGMDDSPNNSVIRERISQLSKNQAVKRAAQEAGIDLKKLREGQALE